MATISQVLSQKAVEGYVSVRPEETVLDATRIMNDQGIGAVLVMHEGQLVGIFTERDVLKRVVAAERHPASTRVGDVMTRDVICIQARASIDEARIIMKSQKVRHLPVVDDDGVVVGMISIGDLNAFLCIDQQVTIHYLTEYLHGRT